MAERHNPARSATGGVRRCFAGRLNTAEHSRKPDERQLQPGADECCYRLGCALRAGRIERDRWAFGFIRSILRHNKRPDWVPSPKQLYAIRNLVAELAESDTGPLIDDGGDDNAAA